MKVFGLDITRARPARKTGGPYEGALINRLTADWPISVLSADAALRWNLRQLRARSRDLERNGGIQERYLSALEANVIGSMGVGLQMKIRDQANLLPINQTIENEWNEFGKRGNFDITGKHSRQDFWRLALRTAARDGDALILIYRGGNVPNRWKIAFQLIEGDYLDDLFNDSGRNNDMGGKIAPGNSIRLGVEVDQYKRKVAFWIFASHPGDYGTEGVYTYDGRRLRIPALGTEPQAPVHCLHLTRVKRAEETRGVPFITPAMMAIRMLEGYEEAELVAARAQACKHVYFTRDQFGPDGSPLDYATEATGGQLTEDIEPGGSTELPIGYKPEFFNPTHPNQSYPDFVKSVKRKIASALNCAYNTLFVDLESVNYSSIRAGLLDEREEWKMKQNWIKDDLVIPSFETWLNVQLMFGTFPGYGLTDFARVNAPEFKFRKWQWVDPLKDAMQARLMLEAKLTTRSRLIADFSNEDFEETIDDIAHENQYIIDAGLDPLIEEPKESAQFIASANQPDDPNADISEIYPPAPNDRSARARAQARHPQTGQFVAKPNGTADSATGKSDPQPQTIIKIEPPAAQNINFKVDSDSAVQRTFKFNPYDGSAIEEKPEGPKKRSFKLTRKDGTTIEGEIEEEQLNATV